MGPLGAFTKSTLTKHYYSILFHIEKYRSINIYHIINKGICKYVISDSRSTDIILLCMYKMYNHSSPGKIEACTNDYTCPLQDYIYRDVHNKTFLCHGDNYHYFLVIRCALYNIQNMKIWIPPSPV